jgi:hypothetical protein
MWMMKQYDKAHYKWQQFFLANGWEHSSQAETRQAMHL